MKHITFVIFLTTFCFQAFAQPKVVKVPGGNLSNGNYADSSRLLGDIFQLRKNGSWINQFILPTPSSAEGTVTSVSATIDGSAIDVSGSPITTNGTFAFTWTGLSTQQVLGDGSLALRITNNNQLTNGAGYITT